MGETLENVNDGYLNIKEKAKDIHPFKMMIHCPGTLPYDDNYDEEYYRHVFAHANSKFSYLLDCDIVNSEVESNGIVCLTTKNNVVPVRLSYNYNNKEYLFNTDLKRFDVLLFPDFIISEYNKELVNTTIYPIKNKIIKGHGNNIYEVSLTLSDTYRLKIFANSEDDAINQSLNIGLASFEHVWPDIEEGIEYKAHVTRASIWHDGMLRVKKI